MSRHGAERLAELFEQALEMTDRQRTDFLEALCENDVEVARELASLLTAYHEAPDALDVLAAHVLPQALDQLVRTLETDTPLRDQHVGRYEIIERLGGGGMGEVYKARDPELNRLVAIKLLPSYLTADPEARARLKSEARAASALDHANIAVVHEIGATESAPGAREPDRLFIVMAYYAGETLGHKIARGPVPIGEALDYAIQVVEGLVAAHGAGMMHRDIKPANLIVTERGQIKIVDFGLAKLAGAELSREGTTRGTIAYMSPEQTRGESLDARTDLWSVGVVLWELVTGERPFRGANDRLLIHAIRHDEPEPVDTLRPEAPAALAAIIRTCLRKAPEDRYSRAVDLVGDLRAAAAGDALSARPGAAPDLAVSGKQTAALWQSLIRRSRVVAGALLFAAALLPAAVWMKTNPRHVSMPAPLDPEVVAVLPFRVGGADPEVAYLREGLVDLFATVFNGDRGLRAVDPRSLLSAWSRGVENEGQDLMPQAATRLAASFRAGRLLLGEVVSLPGQLTLTASLLDVATGAAVASAVASGPPDSLFAIVERLAIQLEARKAGEPEDRISDLTGTPIAAVRAYLAGTAAYRRGDYGLAYGELERAVALDSTFAVAALALLQAYVSASGDAPVTRAAAIIWSLRDRLSTRDRAILEGLTGPVSVEARPATLFTGQILEARRRAALAAPDRPEAWLMLGDAFFHVGRLHAVDSWRERAETALRRALELDSTYVAPLLHLLELAVDRGDTVQIRVRRNQYLARDSTGEHAAFVRWRAAIALGESPTFSRRAEPLERLPLQTLVRMLTAIRTDAVALGDAPHIASALTAQLNRAGEGVVYAGATWGPLIFFTLDRGRPSEAVAHVERWPAHQAARTHILNAIHWDGDRGAATRAAGVLERRARRELDADASGQAGPLSSLCIWQQWRLAHGDANTASRAITRLNATDYPGDRLCALLLGALLAIDSDSATQDVAARELEYFLLRTGVVFGPAHEHANIVLARLQESRGDVAAALAAVRRRGRHPWGAYLSTYLREEGRLAAQVGDAAGAIRAYRHYLALRADSDPGLRVQVTEVARELARLERNDR